MGIDWPVMHLHIRVWGFSRGEARINLPLSLIRPFINQMERGDELNYESGSPTLASGLRGPSHCDVSHVPKAKTLGSHLSQPSPDW